MIIEALYFIKDTCFEKKKLRKLLITITTPSSFEYKRPKRSLQEKKSAFNGYTPFTMTQKDILI